MSFLSKEELRTVIKTEKVTQISGADDQTVTNAINTAITEVAARLTPNNKKAFLDGRVRIDTRALFAQTGDQRNELILSITKIVALWWLIVRSNAGVDYETIRDRYLAATDYLRDLKDGEATDFTLPTLQDPVDDEGNPISKIKPFAAGSKKKFNHDY